MVSWMRVRSGWNGALLDLWYAYYTGIHVHLLVDLCSAQLTYLGTQPPISDVIIAVLRVPVVQVYVVLVICYPEISILHHRFMQFNIQLIPFLFSHEPMSVCRTAKDPCIKNAALFILPCFFRVLLYVRDGGGHGVGEEESRKGGDS